MIKIKFIDEENYYNIKFTEINNNVVRCEGNIPKSQKGFYTYNMNGVKIGDFSKFTTIYRTYNNSWIEFSNDKSEWKEHILIEPLEPHPTQEERIKQLEEALTALLEGETE